MYVVGGAASRSPIRHPRLERPRPEALSLSIDECQIIISTQGRRVLTLLGPRVGDQPSPSSPPSSPGSATATKVMRASYSSLGRTSSDRKSTRLNSSHVAIPYAV